MDEWVRAKKDPQDGDPRMTLTFEQRGGDVVASFIGRPDAGEFVVSSQEAAGSPSTPFTPTEVSVVSLDLKPRAFPGHVGGNSGSSNANGGNGGGGEGGLGWIWLVLVLVVLVAAVGLAGKVMK